MSLLRAFASAGALVVLALVMWVWFRFLDVGVGDSPWVLITWIVLAVGFVVSLVFGVISARTIMGARRTRRK